LPFISPFVGALAGVYSADTFSPRTSNFVIVFAIYVWWYTPWKSSALDPYAKTGTGSSV